jgi:hypothetical protein
MNKDYFLNQLDEILIEFNTVKSKAKYEDLSGNVTPQEISSCTSRSKAAVERITGNKSEYYKDIEDTLKKIGIHDGEKLLRIMGIVVALRIDLDKGYLKSINEIIQSEVFSDYLEMAEHLLQEGYKDPSAVLIGTTIEVHLRELCIANDVSLEILNNKEKLIAKKADVMNADLAKLNVYSGLYQKQIIAWLGIRNSAAHGKYDEYSVEEVKLMLQGIRQFILVTK